MSGSNYLVSFSQILETERRLKVSSILKLFLTKSKQISKIIVATCSQGLYRVIEYADSEYDTKKCYMYIFVRFC